MSQFSVVLPVKNEEAMLNQTIRSIYSLKPDEVIFALDRCTDGTARVIHRAQRHFGHRRTRIVTFDEGDGKGWGFRGAYLRRELYSLARNDIIVNTSADLWLDPEIRNIVKQIPSPYALISFGYFDQPWTYQTLISRLQQKVRRNGFGGLLALDRRAWAETEDLEDLKRIPQGEDDHLCISIMRKYRVHNVATRSLHLRPNTSRKDAYLNGVDYWKQRRAPLHRMIVRTFIQLNPVTLVGYIHTRRVEGRINLNDYIQTVKEAM